jgi:amphi-Trp domain-containing protein
MSEIETQTESTRASIADSLREFANQLDGATAGELPVEEPGHEDGTVTLLVGNRSATINPPEELDFTIEVESDSSLVGTETEEHVRFELSWLAQEVEGAEEELEIK